MSPIRAVPLFVLLFICVGCAGIFGNQAGEPQVVIIRNSSHSYLQVVALREVPKRSHDARRVGSVSPVPPGVSQVVIRPPNAPPLPNEVEVAWSDSKGGRYSKKISLKDLPHKTTGQGQGALVFEIRSSGIVDIFYEN